MGVKRLKFTIVVGTAMWLVGVFVSCRNGDSELTYLLQLSDRWVNTFN